MVLVGDRTRGQADLSSVPCVILMPLWKWASYHKGNRNMEIC